MSYLSYDKAQTKVVFLPFSDLLNQSKISSWKASAATLCSSLLTLSDSEVPSFLKSIN